MKAQKSCDQVRILLPNTCLTCGRHRNLAVVDVFRKPTHASAVRYCRALGDLRKRRIQ